MLGLDPGIHDDVPFGSSRNVFRCCDPSWIAGSSPAMTMERLLPSLHLAPGLALAEHHRDAALQVERARTLQRGHAGVDLAALDIEQVAFPFVVGDFRHSFYDHG